MVELALVVSGYTTSLDHSLFLQGRVLPPLVILLLTLLTNYSWGSLEPGQALRGTQEAVSFVTNSCGHQR